MTHPLPAPPRADWEMEAKRISAAFGLRNEWELERKQSEETYEVRRHETHQIYLFIENGVLRSFNWMEEMGVWTWESRLCAVPPLTEGEMTIYWIGDRILCVPDLFKKAIVKLFGDKGAAALEAQTGLTISAHERIEWMLDFKERMREGEG